jgi:hypothetical protein
MLQTNATITATAMRMLRRTGNTSFVDGRRPNASASPFGPVGRFSYPPLSR